MDHMTAFPPGDRELLDQAEAATRSSRLNQGVVRVPRGGLVARIVHVPVDVADLARVESALSTAEAFFVARDEMNAAVHTPHALRLSPITEQVVEARRLVTAIVVGVPAAEPPRPAADDEPVPARERTCERCGGRGTERGGDALMTCQGCGGTGSVPIPTEPTTIGAPDGTEDE